MIAVFYTPNIIPVQVITMLVGFVNIVFFFKEWFGFLFFFSLFLEKKRNLFYRLVIFTINRYVLRELFCFSCIENLEYLEAVSISAYQFYDNYLL